MFKATRKKRAGAGKAMQAGVESGVAGSGKAALFQQSLRRREPFNAGRAPDVQKSVDNRSGRAHFLRSLRIWPSFSARAGSAPESASILRIECRTVL